MPTCRLPAMTTAPNAIIAMATPISTLRWAGPLAGVSVMRSLSCRLLLFRRANGLPANNSPAVSRFLRSVGGGEEARFLHQVAVAVLFLLDPLGVVGAGHEALIERAVMH